MYILTLFNWTSLFLLLYNVTEVNYMQQQYDIGKRLREVMAERGVTISQLAELTDVSEERQDQEPGNTAYDIHRRRTWMYHGWISP